MDDNKYSCPECGGEMEVKDVLISRTTDPKYDDLFEKMWACNNCDHVEPITEDDGGEE